MNELRINIEDVIRGNEIDNIINKINEISHKEFKVIFWYNGNLDGNQIKEFINEVTKKIKVTSVDFVKDSPSEKFAWFDLINTDKNKNSKHRFGFVYSKHSQMIRGIDVFCSTLDFVNQTKNHFKRPKKDLRK